MATIAGCKELPVASDQKDTKVKVFDSLEILAKNAVERAKE